MLSTAALQKLDLLALQEKEIVLGHKLKVARSELEQLEEKGIVLTKEQQLLHDTI
ncbi:unnamed protein product, partial [Amoebophrya sp. A120]|eukprot:GSA120T00012071001.1